MSELGNSTLEAILLTETQKAATATAATEAYNREKAQWDQVQAAWIKYQGKTPSKIDKDKIFGLVKKYGPKIAIMAGLPGAGATITAITADPGSFSTLKTVFGKALSVFGLG